MSGSDTDDGGVDDVRLTRSRSLRVPHVFQTLQPEDERQLRAERRARALAAARETELVASQALAAANAAAAIAAAMANGAASAASSSGTQLGMPSGPAGTSGSVGAGQSTSQMAGSQFSPLTPRGRELLELQQVERIRERLERELKQATDREKEVKNRTARRDTLEADKTALEGLDESAMSVQMKVLKNSVLSLHAHVDSRLDFMQNSLDQILDLLQRPGFRPAAQSLLPLTTMSGAFPVQAGTQPSGTSAATTQTVASSSSGSAVIATPSPQQPVPQQGQQQGQWYPKTPMKPPLAFSGEKKDKELNTRLRTFPVWVRAKRTMQEEEVITAASYLEGKAAKWLDGLVAKARYGRRMADWAKTLTLEEFLDMVEARWHNPQQAQIATDAMLRLDQQKFKSVRELTTTVESLIVIPGIRYDDQVLLTMFVRCLPENLRNLLASEARLEYHSFETLSRKALDLEATLGSAQPTPVDARNKKGPQEWKKKGSKLMMVEPDGTQTEIEELTDLLDNSEYDGEDIVEGSTLTAVVKTKTLKWIKTQPALSDALKRWIEVIDKYDFKLEYLKGEYNKVADALSRRADYLGALVSEFGVSEELTQSLVGAYQEDPVMMDIIRKLQAKDKATKYEFVMVDRILFLDKAGFKRLVVPSSERLRSLFLGECHDATGHFGYKKTSANLVQRLWWPGMLEDAKKYVETCQVCQRDKPRTQAPLGLLKPLPIPAGPGQSVSMDFMNTLVTSKNGKRHIFVIIDRFTKYARLIAMPETARTEHVIKLFLDNWVRDFGLPKSIVSDRGVHFTSELWKKTAEQMGSQLQMTSGNHPEANGQAEQMNRVVQHLLRHYIKPSQDDWDEKLPLLASLYNNAVHSSTGVSPNQLHLGWKPRSALDFLLPENRSSATPGTLEYGVQYEKLLHQAVEKIKKSLQAMIAS
ncbi:hypothetical protein CBR_g34229 [Chara braunii]|uniref:Integrase catalytic domain-containing protein n=1 Tax=Chara braunii TaxID=69332 RepID=A0A388JYJ2_CHABU|nr:hypothetical protein CBR_g34229 [Chara braunii]|eukprot:GBG62858.1 hypothetical protein CBR_g34229 [Chara braunii]